MSEFGYIPEAPEQSFGNNKGIFTPKDIYDLTRADKYTNYGQLELINTTNASGLSSIIWSADDLAGYNVHFMTYNDVEMFDAGIQDYLALRLSFDGGSTYPTSSYQRATQLFEGTNFYESRGSNEGKFRLATHGGDGNNETKNGYVYMYNFLDSTKFTTCLTASSSVANSFSGGGSFSSSVNQESSPPTHIKFIVMSGGAFDGNISMYGIRYA